MTALDVQTGEVFEVHPVADLFPMLADDELAELAADIAERGLLQPIVLDIDGRVLDGRNRLAACRMAGVEPAFVTYDGDDPDGYALAANGQRRDLTKSKRAVVAAQAISLVPKEWGDQARMARVLQVSEALVSQAKTTIAHAPDLAGSVLSGAVSLDVAYDTARKNKQGRDSREAQMARLRSDAPDLADLVTEERMVLSDAVAALDAREIQRESERRAATANLRSVLTYLTSISIKPAELAEQYADVLDDFKQDDLDYATQTMAAIAALKQENR